MRRESDSRADSGSQMRSDATVTPMPGTGLFEKCLHLYEDGLYSSLVQFVSNLILDHLMRHGLWFSCRFCFPD